MYIVSGSRQAELLGNRYINLIIYISITFQIKTILLLTMDKNIRKVNIGLLEVARELYYNS